MTQFQLIDTVSLSSKINSSYACKYSEDGRIFILTDSLVLVFTLMNYPDKSFSNFVFKKRQIETPKYNFSNELGIELDDFYEQLPRKDLFEIALRLDLSGDLPFSSPVEFKVIKSAWSPRGLLGKSKCLIATLSNYFGLHIYAKEFTDGAVEKYNCVANVTQQIIKHHKIGWGNVGHLNGPLQIAELRKRVENTCSTAFSWSHLFSIGDKRFAVIFIGHPNGTVGAWKFNERMEGELSQSNLTLMGKCTSSLKCINHIHWYQTRKLGGALIVSDNDGNTVVFSVSVDQNAKTINFEPETSLWNESDKMKVEEIVVFEYQNTTYLIIVKQSFLLVFGINEEGSVFDQVIYDTGNLLISGILHFKKNKLLILSFSGALKLLTINLLDKKINIDEHIVPIKLDCTKYKTHGIIMSKNQSLLGILATPSQNKNLVRDNTPTKFFVYHNTSVDCIQLLMSNCSDGIYRHFDCLEILRLTCIKEKKFPWEKMDLKLDYDKLSLPELKALRIIATLSENVYTIVPYIKEYKLKSYILIHYLLTIKHVIKRMRKLLFLFATTKQLTKFQLQSLDIQNMYLKEVVAKKILEKSEVGEQFVDDITEVMEKANMIEYPLMPPCFWCGQRVIGPTCVPLHADSRCVISMMPIMLIPGFKCEFCQCVAHLEIAKESKVVLCPYCDYPMDQLYSSEMINEKLKTTPENLRRGMAIALSANIPEKVSQPEFPGESLSVNDVDDNYLEFVTISDDEEEATLEKRSTMSQAFKEMIKLANCSGNADDFENINDTENYDSPDEISENI